MRAIERANEPKFDGILSNGTVDFNAQDRLPRKKLVEIINHYGSRMFDRASVPDDLFGNSVPGCLVVLNKRKAPEHKGKILLIWASRHYQSSNPQNILRRADCMRVLVPWRAFGDLEQCSVLIPNHEQELITEIEQERNAALQDLEDAYAPFLAPLPELIKEFTECEDMAKKTPPKDKEALKAFRV